jgi:hypothetical protein
MRERDEGEERRENSGGVGAVLRTETTETLPPSVWTGLGLACGRSAICCAVCIDTYRHMTVTVQRYSQLVRSCATLDIIGLKT